MPQVGRHVEELEDVRLVVLDGNLILQFVGMMRRFDAAGEPVPLRLEGRQWLARLERVRPAAQACHGPQRILYSVEPYALDKFAGRLITWMRATAACVAGH